MIIPEEKISLATMVPYGLLAGRDKALITLYVLEKVDLRTWERVSMPLSSVLRSLEKVGRVHVCQQLHRLEFKAQMMIRENRPSKLIAARMLLTNHEFWILGAVINVVHTYLG